LQESPISIGEREGICHGAGAQGSIDSTPFPIAAVEKPGYVNVDQLQAETLLETAAAKCGMTLDVKGTGREVRLDCPFGCAGDHVGRKELSVNTENPQKVFCCHAYGCQLRGNLLTLMHGWVTRTRPAGDKLKGEEFNRVKKLLVGSAIPSRPAATGKQGAKPPATEPPPENVPLAAADNEKARELANLDEKFVVEPASMNPLAAAYVRRHPALSPESMRKWRVGYLPHDGGGDKRGWSLRGHLIYPLLSADGQVLTWVGRDPSYDEKERVFTALPPAQRSGETPPAKHKFPKGFHRGLELFGQQTARLKEPGYRDAIARHGILVVEGFNDVIGLDNLAIPAVAICSNKITAAQVAKLTQWARHLAGGKVSLLFDCEPTGDDGAKEALWLLSQQGLDVRLAWSLTMHGGQFADRQPESLTREEWESALRPTIERP